MQSKDMFCCLSYTKAPDVLFCALQEIYFFMVVLKLKILITAFIKGFNATQKIKNKKTKSE